MDDLTFAVLGPVDPVVVFLRPLKVWPGRQLPLAAEDAPRLAGERGEAEPAERARDRGRPLLPIPAEGPRTPLPPHPAPAREGQGSRSQIQG